MQLYAIAPLAQFWGTHTPGIFRFGHRSYHHPSGEPPGLHQVFVERNQRGTCHNIDRAWGVSFIGHAEQPHSATNSQIHPKISRFGIGPIHFVGPKSGKFMLRGRD